MRRLIGLIALFTISVSLLSIAPSDASFFDFLRSLSITNILQPGVKLTGPNDDQISEGNTYKITWDSTSVDKTVVKAVGHRTSYPGSDRGNFNITLADTKEGGSHSFNWRVPFLDTVNFRIIARGYDQNGNQISEDSRQYKFRPGVLKTRHDDGIYIDVRNETRQRLYVLKGDKLTHAYLTSGSRANEYYPKNVHPNKPHDHDGVFKILDKHEKWHSKLFDVDMFWAMRYWSGHFIHGTYPSEYHKLGTPASSGCNRLQKEQAKELYDMTPVGTRVEIIAKNKA